MKTESKIKCPSCGFEKTESMPTNSCQIIYHCTECKTTLKPKEGDCCVFCSYADTPCPPIQDSKKLEKVLTIPLRAFEKN